MVLSAFANGYVFFNDSLHKTIDQFVRSRHLLCSSEGAIPLSYSLDRQVGIKNIFYVLKPFSRAMASKEKNDKDTP